MAREKLWDHLGTGTTLKNGGRGLAFADSHCGAYGVIYLNAWFPVGGTILEELGRDGLVGGDVAVEGAVGFKIQHP